MFYLQKKMENQILSQKIIIPHKIIQSSKAKEILENLRWVSDDEIDRVCETEKTAIENIEKQLIVKRVLKGLSNNIKVEENTTEFGLKWTKVSALIWWHRYNYFIPDDNLNLENDTKNLIENNAYYASEITTMMVNIVKFLLSFSWIEREDLFPWSIYVESVKKALKLDKRFRIANKDKENDRFYWVNLESWWYALSEYNDKYLPKLLLKIKDSKTSS